LTVDSAAQQLDVALGLMSSRTPKLGHGRPAG